MPNNLFIEKKGGFTRLFRSRDRFIDFPAIGTWFSIRENNQETDSIRYGRYRVAWSHRARKRL